MAILQALQKIPRYLLGSCLLISVLLHAQKIDPNIVRKKFEETRQLLETARSPEDKNKAFTQLQKLAEDNNPIAQDWLGTIYENGQNGLTTNLAEAQRYYQMAADNEFSQAQMHLGRMYLFGVSGPIDVTEGIFWLKKAALGDNAEAALLLARHYESLQREDVANLLEAAFWLKMTQGPLSATAQQNLQRVNSYLSVEQRLNVEQRFNAARKKSPVMVFNRNMKNANSESKDADNIETKTSQTTRSGTGFWVNSDSFALTSLHVVDGCNTIEAQESDGITQVMRLISRDPKKDLALLQGHKNSRNFVTFNTSPLEVGENLATLGYPFGGIISDRGTFTTGIINAILDMDQGRNNLFQFSASIQPGNSGGPIVNEKGQLIGMVSSTLSNENIWVDSRALPQNVNFAISSKNLSHFLGQSKVVIMQGVGHTVLRPTEIYKRLLPITLRLRCLN